jgi:hypothetical protein
VDQHLSCLCREECETAVEQVRQLGALEVDLEVEVVCRARVHGREDGSVPALASRPAAADVAGDGGEPAVGAGRVAQLVSRRTTPETNAVSCRTRDFGNHWGMDVAAEIIAFVVVLLSVAVVAGVFVWAAIKDGQEDRALQKRLGIRRWTRLGR